jgi:hypothetical protein
MRAAPQLCAPPRSSASSSGGSTPQVSRIRLRDCMAIRPGIVLVAAEITPLALPACNALLVSMP